MISYSPLQKVLRERGISLDELQGMIGRNQNMRARLNNGDYIALAEVDKICDVLGLNVSDVITFEKGKQPVKDSTKMYYLNWETIDRVREEKHISYYRMSQECRQHVSYISKTKSRKGQVPEAVVFRLIGILGVKKEDLILELENNKE